MTVQWHVIPQEHGKPSVKRLARAIEIGFDRCSIGFEWVRFGRVMIGESSNSRSAIAHRFEADLSWASHLEHLGTSWRQAPQEPERVLDGILEKSRDSNRCGRPFRNFQGLDLFRRNRVEECARRGIGGVLRAVGRVVDLRVQLNQSCGFFEQLLLAIEPISFVECGQRLPRRLRITAENLYGYEKSTSLLGYRVFATHRSLIFLSPWTSKAL